VSWFLVVERSVCADALGGEPESLWDEALPIEVRELPEDLAELDGVLADPELMMVLLERWREEVVETGRLVLTDGRPTIAMETYVRLMVLKARYRWGYRSLVVEVSDSIHLRRFCRIVLSERVPDESTVRKLTRRIGAETVNELTRCLIVEATRSQRFRARAVRIDSTVIEADVKFPTDADLAAHGVRVLAREGQKLAKLVRESQRRVRDRSRSVGRKLRALTRTIRRRSGEAKSEVLKVTAETGELLQRSVTETRALAVAVQRKARGRGAKTKLTAAAKLEGLADRCEKVAAQIKQRVAGEPIRDRLVSLADPDARPIRKGKLGKPTEFGYVNQLAEVTENTRRGAWTDPAGSHDAREPGRGHAAAPDRRRTETARALTARGCARWWIQRRPDPPGVRTPHPGPGVHRRAPATRLQTHPTTDAALSNRCRRTDQSPQTQLRDGPIPPQRRRRPPDLDRMGDPCLTLTRSPSGPSETLRKLLRQEQPLTTNRPREIDRTPFIGPPAVRAGWV
jgi:IS5 family transposase